MAEGTSRKMIVVKRTVKDIDALHGVEVHASEIRDDGTDYLGKKIKKPWGYEIERYKDEMCSVWWLYLNTHQQTSMHCHPNKTTLLMIIGGTAKLSTLNGSHELSAGDMVVIEKGAFHRTTAYGKAVVLYELETPPNKRDLIRLEDFYGRGQGYENVA